MSEDMLQEIWVHETLDYIETVNTNEPGLRKYLAADTCDAQYREKLAAFMLDNSIPTGHGDTFDDLLGELREWIRELQEVMPISPEGDK